MNEKQEDEVDSNVSEDSDLATKKGTGFPTKALYWTVFVAVVLGLLHGMRNTLNDQMGMDPAIPGLLTVPLGFITYLVWVFWAFLSKRFLTGLLILGLPILFFVFYYPKLTGDVGIDGFKPRFWAVPTDFAEVDKVAESDATVQLTPTDLDFPQFLGAQRDGTVNGISLASTWDTPPKLLWKQDVGEGWSGFVVVNGYAITQEQRGTEECVTCYDVTTGELMWINRVERRHEDTMAMGKVGPRATPSIDEGLVYATSGVGMLDCLDGATGKLVWTADIPSLVGIEQVEKTNSMGLKYTEEKSALAWGRSCSPLIVGDLVIVPAGGPLPSEEDGTVGQMITLIAFDKKTGQEVWRGGSRMIAYGSPSVATLGGKQQILLVAESHVVGHDAQTGEELWSYERMGHSNQDANCSQATVVDDSHLIVSKAYGLGGELIEVTENDDQWNVKVIHQDPRILKTKFTSPVLYQGHAYSLSDGFLECVEVDSFKRKWRQRGRFGNGQVLIVGDKLIVHAENGKVMLVKASPAGYEELASMPTIRGICWNTLCLYGDLLLLRSDLEAACFRLPLETESSDSPSADAPEEKDAL